MAWKLFRYISEASHKYNNHMIISTNLGTLLDYLCSSTSDVRVSRSMPVFFYRGHISQHCYTISASNLVQRFVKGLGTFASTNYVKISALVKNTWTFFFIFCHFSLQFWGNNRFYTPAHSDLQYSAMNNHFCIPDWLPKETMQVSDCNFDPAPPEMLLFTAKKCRFLSIYPT